MKILYYTILVYRFDEDFVVYYTCVQVWWGIARRGEQRDRRPARNCRPVSNPSMFPIMCNCILLQVEHVLQMYCSAIEGVATCGKLLSGWQEPKEFIRTKRSSQGVIRQCEDNLSSQTSVFSPHSSLLGPQSLVLSPRLLLAPVLNPRSTDWWSAACLIILMIRSLLILGRWSCALPPR